MTVVPAAMDVPTDAALDCRQIVLDFGDRRVLDHVSLQVAARECVALLGCNGAGKSSLLRIMAGLQPPTTGVVRVYGQGVAGAVRRREVGLLFQGRALVPRLSVEANVLCGSLGEVPGWRTLLGFPPALVARSRRILADLGLEELMYQQTSKLSGGEQQRVAIARSLMQNPRILLADEPTTGLDVVAAERVMRTLRSLPRARGTTVVLVLHDLACVEAFCDRAVVLDAGAVAYDGPCQDLRSRFPQLEAVEAPHG